MGKSETCPILGLGLFFDALMRTIDREDETFLSRLEQHLEQEYRKLEDSPGDHEEEMRFMLGVKSWIVTQLKPGYELP